MVVLMAVLRMMAVKVMHGDKVECLILSCFGVLITNRQTKERRNEETNEQTTATEQYLWQL